MPSLTVSLTTAPNDAVRLLIAELDDVLSAEYPPEQRHGLPLEALFQPHVRFFVATLACIEAETRAAGLPVLRLETGDKQTDALRLYYRYGFTDCPPFGDYAVLKPHTISTSIFLEKPVANVMARRSG
jgi:putative acetyltransferase